MERRTTILALIFAGAVPLTVQAQSSKPVRRIGWLSTATPERQRVLHEAFVVKLKELGYIEGRDFVLDKIYSTTRAEPLPTLARELIARNPEVIVTSGGAAIAALSNETKTVPIVFYSGAEVVEQGVVKSFAQPGGNITGVTVNSEISGKLVQLIQETLPLVRRVAAIEDDSVPGARIFSPIFQRAATALRLQLSIVRIRRVEEFDRAFADMARDKVQAVLVPPTSLFDNNVERITELAMKARLPVFTGFRLLSRLSFLLSYSSDATENFRRAAVLVDKILKGAKPSDLPVEQPDRFVLRVNLRTAKALNITIPQSILARADDVIQ